MESILPTLYPSFFNKADGFFQKYLTVNVPVGFISIGELIMANIIQGPAAPSNASPICVKEGRPPSECASQEAFAGRLFLLRRAREAFLQRACWKSISLSGRYIILWKAFYAVLQTRMREMKSQCPAASG